MAIDPLSIKNSQAGSIGIAIGNGPSLNAIPTDFLLKYRTFGVNYINRLPFQPTYYVCIDSDVLANNASSILNVASSAEISFLS